ncbi:MAG: DUF167 domain-containing protein [Candidatus Omnitrophica bacterium]|nr:DUF167 domain-containing protein [Candidatus Omnitrophota bacterium]
MKISVQVKAGSKRESVEKIDEKHYRVTVKAPPREGLANEAVIRALKERFGVPKSLVTIVSGHRAKRKIVEIATR